MKITNIISLLILVLFCSCQSKETKYSENAIQLFNIALNDVEPIVLPPHIERLPHENEMEHANRSSLIFSKKREEFESKKDDIIMNLYVSDSLINSNLLFVEKESFRKEISKGLFQKIDDKLTQHKNIDIKNFSLDKNISLVKNKFETEKLDISEMDDLYQFSANIQFSNVIYNNDFTEAIFFYDLTCGVKCGYTHIVFSKKINSKWISKEIGLYIN